MAFYQSIADHYDDVFPLNPVQAEFVKSSLEDFSNAAMLDVGCGTGSLCIALAKNFKKVIGIDPDESMLKIARKKAGNESPNLHFLPYGMLDIEEHFEETSIDVILCLGNTLVHLATEEEILDFLTQSKKLLKPGGRLLMQIINYDRIINQDIKALATIENDRIKFVRSYRYQPQNNILDFETLLTIKGNSKEIKNCIQLLPIRKTALESLMIKAGFEEISFFGNFKKAPLLDDSVPIVVEAAIGDRL